MNVISSKKCGSKIVNLLFLTAIFTKKLTNKSVLILYEYPKTVANLNTIEFLCFKIIFSASTLVLLHKDIGFKGDFSSQNLFLSPMPYPELVFG